MITNDKIFINDDWLWTPKFDKKIISEKFKIDSLKEKQIVRLPHTFCETPLNYFDESIYQMDAGYRKEFKTLATWEHKRVFITFEGAAHKASVYLNGKLLGEHASGYTAFTFELTNHLAPVGKKNVLAVELSSMESLDVPPFGFVIDYMTFSGLYRDVYLEVKNEVFVSDTFIHTNDRNVTTDVAFCGKIKKGYSVRLSLYEWKKDITESSLKKPLFTKDFNIDNALCITTNKDNEARKDSMSAVPQNENTLFTPTALHGTTVSFNFKAPITIKFWSPENPSLYLLRIELLDSKKKILDETITRFGFRDIQLTVDGLFVNGKKVLIRGLNRHQSFPYVGYAMPKSIQEYDAEILKNELALNAVRTSHYPQSQYFIDRCDELGLLVFTEIPGWQHIGQSPEWRAQCVQNVREMVEQYRNHPSIFLWGVRINESKDDDELYQKTNDVAHALDPTRLTGGVRCIKKSHLLEDVYTYNDFIHDGTNEGCSLKSDVTPDAKKPYFITEYCGHMFPTKSFDNEEHRTSHATRHANIINAVASHNNILGSYGWCAFDYNTHEDFGSGDRICYHGVMDMFRNPKLASYVYKCQQDETPVLEVSSSMDVGEHPACVRGFNWIFTNATSVRMYLNDVFITEYYSATSPYQNILHGPILIDDYLGHRLVDEEGLDESTSDAVRAIGNYTAMYGQNCYTVKHAALFLKLKLKGFSFEKLRALYDKYIGNWGGNATVYKFEAIKDGKVVKTIYKGPVKEINIDANVSKNILHEETSWDASAIRICMKDQYGNVLPYYNESVVFKTKGPIEIIGPSVSSFKGGLIGTWIKTTGKKGKASLEIESGNKKLSLNFSVN